MAIQVDENLVRVFDTTLRDGEQSPGATLTSAEKLEIARQLANLGVDIIEAGFPAASPDDLAAVQRIATRNDTLPADEQRRHQHQTDLRAEFSAKRENRDKKYEPTR